MGNYCFGCSSKPSWVQQAQFAAPTGVLIRASRTSRNVRLVVHRRWLLAVSGRHVDWVSSFPPRPARHNASTTAGLLSAVWLDGLRRWRALTHALSKPAAVAISLRYVLNQRSALGSSTRSLYCPGYCSARDQLHVCSTKSLTSPLTTDDCRCTSD